MVARAHPEAELVLLDGAGEMLAQARERLGDRASYVNADLGGPLPEGPWDAVVSALAIHHLDAAGKRDLFGRVHDALAPGGMFVNAEQVLGPTPELDAVYRERHREQALALGVRAAEWEATLERMSHDRCDTVSDQLAWLAEAGFTDVDSPWRSGRFAVFAARRAT
jgi:tRNA (cmo5U34)-methyltransferase